MSYLTTGVDLKLDAFSLAGEPSDGTSSYTDQQVYEWLTVAMRAVISGGVFGPSYLEPVDWFWARAWPRGAIQLVQPYNQASLFTATFTIGQLGVLVNPLGTLPDLSGYRILKADVPARHLIDHVDNTSLTTIKTIYLREPWTGDNDVTANWLAYPDTYQLPADFVHGTSPLFLYSFPAGSPTTQTIDVVEAVDLERWYPQTFPWGGTTSVTVTGSGMPVLAARVTDTRIRFSHFLDTPSAPFSVQAEFEYIRRPEVIAEGTIPPIPIEHRRILSYGAAYLILDDKKSSQQTSIMQHFLAQYKAMRDEHARDLRRMSTRSGVVQPPRLSGNRMIRLTETGLPVYVW